MGGDAPLPLGSALDNEAEDELKGSKETDPREGAGPKQRHPDGLGHVPEFSFSEFELGRSHNNLYL